MDMKAFKTRLQACGCPHCRNILEATQRLEMVRDERELRVGMAGVKLLSGDLSDWCPPESS